MEKERIEEIDLLKCVLITLMVMFHLRYFADKHPDLKDFVYTFHMPAFLLISGFFSGTWQADRLRHFFSHRILWLLVPYVLMETAYAIASTFFPVRNGLTDLNFHALANALVLDPVGPYWFLHTLIICSTVLFLASRFGLLLPCLLLFFLSEFGLGLVGVANAIYFMIGAFIKRYAGNFFRVFRPGLLFFVPLAFLGIWNSGTLLFSLPITYCAISGIFGGVSY